VVAESGWAKVPGLEQIRESIIDKKKENAEWIAVFGQLNNSTRFVGVNRAGRKRILVTGVSQDWVWDGAVMCAHGAKVVALRDWPGERATAEVRKDSEANGGSFEMLNLILRVCRSVRDCAKRLEKGVPSTWLIA